MNIFKKTLKIFGLDAICIIKMSLDALDVLDESNDSHILSQSSRKYNTTKNWEGSFEIGINEAKGLTGIGFPENWRNKIETEIGDICITSIRPDWHLKCLIGTFVGIGKLKLKTCSGNGE